MSLELPDINKLIFGIKYIQQWPPEIRQFPSKNIWLDTIYEPKIIVDIRQKGGVTAGSPSLVEVKLV